MESAILSIYNKIKVSPLGRFIGRHPKKVIIVVIGTYLYIQRSRDRKKRIEQERERKLLGLSESESHRKSLRINKQFYNQLSKILKIVLPGVRTKQFFILALHTFFLITRTYLSIVVARLDGSIVKNIVDRNLRGFLWRLALWLGIALPATYVNSMIRYLEGKLAIELRTKLVDYLYSLYMENDTYYKVENLDSRLKNADQGLTDDASRFCTNLAHLYSQLSKPILDICLMTVQLVLLAKKTTDGASGKSGKGNDTAFYSASLAYAVITLTAQLLRTVSPPFGKLASQQAKLEGELRAAHSRVITNSEEIAFYGGHKVELSYLKKSYLNLIKHLNLILKSKIVYTMLEGFSMKYLWSATGLLMIAIPNFARNVEGDTQTSSQRTESYIYAKGLLINGADACERIMSSYKEITEFAGFTHRVYELIQVFEDISIDKYKKQMSSTANVNLMDSRGTVVEDNMVKFDAVPIVSPNGDVLIESMSFELKPGMHCLITGPNGCGKSSLFRILSGLWPVYKGKLTKPHRKDLFYIPQSAYLTVGTLRDQVLYPHSMSDLSKSEAESIDQRLTQILSWVDLTSIVEREENGFNAVRVWEDTLSGGEKQRLAMARLFYHKPLFAILDECTSAVSIDVEGKMYSKAKELGITLLTVSHRHTLWKYHNYLLQYDGCKNYSFSELNAEVRLSLREEKNQIEEQLQNVPSKQKRLKELCLLLGEDSRYVDNQPQSQVEIIENN